MSNTEQGADGRFTTRTQEEPYRTLVETSEDLIWQMDRSGCWTYLNPAAETVYGKPPAQLLGAPFEDFCAPEHFQSDVGMLQELFNGHSVVNHETVHKRADGYLVYLSFNASPIVDDNGTITGACGTAREVAASVTERDRLEHDLEEATKGAHAKSAFLANMSHEIRTPMNGIIGMTELLVDAELDPDQRRALDLIRTSADALLNIINDVLDFSKIEAGWMTLEETDFDVSAMLDSVVRVLSVRAFEKDLDLVFDVKPGVPRNLIGDPGRLRQIINNLVGNAIKFTDDGEIVITVESLSVEGGEHLLKFSVRDTGIGIAGDRLETIFKEFDQGGAPASHREGGTGLGLAISRRMVRMMGGEITVESEEGTGSTFAFQIKLKAGEPRREVAKKRPVADASILEGKRILVVDDHGASRELLADIFRSVDAVPRSVTDGISALEMIRDGVDAGRTFDLAIFDTVSSSGDGFELAQQMREVGGEDMKLLVLTGSGQRGDAAKCREYGIQGYLSKPVSRAELLEIATSVIRGEEQADRSGLVTRHLVNETRHALRILVAEDNAVNQEVAASILNRRGHTVDVVSNGLEAVDAVQNMQYDVVLMDIQMPELDGHDATRRIRAIPGMDTLPILAMTAHALDGEEKKCVDSGMNGYISKPFQPHELFAAIEGWGRAKVDPKPVVEVAPEVVVDLKALREMLREGGIEDAFEGMLDLFLQDSPRRITALEKAAHSSNGEAVMIEAHTLKSAAATLRAERLVAELQRLEEAGRKGDIAGALSGVPDLKNEYARVEGILKAAIAA